MKQNDIDFLNNNRNHYETLTKAGFIQNLSNDTKSEFLRIIRENFSPGYLCCMHCNGDIAAMVQYVYIQYDNMPKEDIKPIIYNEKNEDVLKEIAIKKRGKKPKQ